MAECAKVQKYEQGKIGLQLFDTCYANNVVEPVLGKLESSEWAKWQTFPAL